MNAFTHVSLKLATGENLIPVKEWQIMPLSNRTKAILSKSATFIKNGEIIPISDILQAMKAAA